MILISQSTITGELPCVISLYPPHDGYTIFQTLIGDERPTMGELNKYLTEYCGLWRSVGYKLELQDSVLNVIQSDHPTQRMECFRIVLQKWLEQDVRPTWNILELAITNARREELSLEPLLESEICFFAHI